MKFLTANIQGWMGDKELVWLYEQARDMDSVVEIGCWKGRSTLALLEGCKGEVHAVDHFHGSWNENRWEGDPHYEAKLVDIYSVFCKNVMGYSNIRIHRMPSLNAARKLQDQRFDMVFIDGAHDYKSIRADLDLWLPLTNKLICGHDWGHDPVVEAVTEVLGKEAVESYESIWYHRLG